MACTIYRRASMVEKTCPHCGGTFSTKDYEGTHARKFCSRECRYAAARGRVANDAQLAALARGRASTHAAASGPDHYAWKGARVGYDAVHRWMARRFPESKATCDHCGIAGPLDWAMIHGRHEPGHRRKTKSEGTYSRRREDWLRLCDKCHGRYDRKPECVQTTTCATCGETFSFRPDASKLPRRFCSRACWQRRALR